MYKDKTKCPNCGEETIPKLWMGYNPPVCEECGKPAWTNPKIEC